MMSTQPMNSEMNSEKSIFNFSTVIFILLAIFIIFIIVVVASAFYDRSRFSGKLDRTSLSQALNGATQARVELKLGATRLQLDGNAAANTLIEGQVETLAGLETLRQTSSPNGPNGNVLTFRLEATRPAAVAEPPQWPVWALHLNRNIPTELSISGGLGPSALDLRQLRLTSLRLAPAASRLSATLPASGQVQAVVLGGLSRTELNIPASMTLRLRVIDRALGHVELSGRRLPNGWTLASPDYERANNRLDLEVTADIGHIVIERVQ
jgi:hypothetical protein